MKGSSRHDYARKARAELDYCALIVVGPVQPLWLFRGQNRPILPITFAVSAQPDSQVVVARRWNFARQTIWREWWTVGRPLAERLERKVLAYCDSGGMRLEIPGMDTSEKWWDMDWPKLEQVVAWCACLEGVETMTAEERDEEHEIRTRRIVARERAGFAR